MMRGNRLLSYVLFATLHGCGESVSLDTTIPDSARPAVDALLNKAWIFSRQTGKLLQTKGVPIAASFERVPSRISCRGVWAEPIFVLPDGIITSVFYGEVILPMPDGAYLAYGSSEGGIQTGSARDPSSYKNFSDGGKIVDADFWSFTAALTPGGHHVRLYLEMKGKISTLVSAKDNFTKFQRESSPRFRSVEGRSIGNLRPRDPKVALSHSGVYVMTWDNRDPEIGPDDPATAEQSFSPTFGMAFSIDGLDWTVHSNELYIEGLAGSVPVGQNCTDTITGNLNRITPVFVAEDRIALFYAFESGRDGTCQSGTRGTHCGAGQAISN